MHCGIFMMDDESLVLILKFLFLSEENRMKNREREMKRKVFSDKFLNVA